MEFPDRDNLIFENKRIRVHACDANYSDTLKKNVVENWDLIEDGQFKYCLNLRHFDPARAQDYYNFLCALIQGIMPED